MRFFPIATDGWRFILPLLAGGIWFTWYSQWFLRGLGILLLLGAIFCMFFFRDFDRKTPSDPAVIYSPGDGKILQVGPSEDPTLGKGTIIRIFLSVLDGHVQRSPMKGTVENIRYKRGTFLDARDPRAHLENEQNAVLLKNGDKKLLVTQIAGLIARRIVCWVAEGENLDQGERYGLIRFGSQVDVFTPNDIEILVKPGDRVVGGRTILGKWVS